MNKTTDLLFDVHERLSMIAAQLKRNPIIGEALDECAVRELQERVNDHWRELMQSNPTK